MQRRSATTWVRGTRTSCRGHVARWLSLAGLSIASLVDGPSAHAAPTKASASPAPAARVDVAVKAFARERLGLLGVPPSLRGFVPSTVPVTLEWDHTPTSADLAALEALGAKLVRDRDGRPLGGPAIHGGAILASEVPASALEPLGKLRGLRRARLDAPVLPAPRPLDYTAQLVGAKDTWSTRTDTGSPLTGDGVTICDVDAGIDVLHPMMFKADGGYYDFIDMNDNGRFDPGVDAVDLGAGPVVVRAMNGIVSTYYDETPLFGSEDPAFDPKLDFLYADENGDGKREAGKKAGFTEATPTYGERLLVIDDVDQNGLLDRGEKLVALGTSKIRAFRLADKVYRRGVDLVDAPFDPSMLHGVGATTVLAGGARGLTGLVGMAPDAELVMATDPQGGRDYQMTAFCVSEGARVVLHEYAPWVGYHLDGSSPTEQLIDSSSEKGVAHVNPAGNLSTSDKHYVRVVSSGSTTPLAIDIPNIGISYWATSVLFRDTSRALTMTLSGPDGTTKPVDATPTGAMIDWGGGLTLYSQRIDSDRGTARVDIYLVSPNATPVPIPVGAWTLTVVDPTPPGGPDFTLFAYTMDEVSGWGKGAAFTDHASEDHLIGYPGTADHGMPISAFTAHDFSGATPGERAYYSGRGFRLDGTKILWIAGPDNPITAGRFEDRELSYIVYGGTSGASPHVAGSAALMIQHDPAMKGDQVKAAIKAGATVDAFTGAVPNDDFGWGKIDVYRAIYGKDRPGGGPPSLQVPRLVMAPLGPSEVAFGVSDPDEPASAIVLELDRDYDGVYDELLAGPLVSLSPTAVGTTYMKIRATDSTGKATTALLGVKVDASATGASSSSGGATGEVSLAGGGCTVGRVEASRALSGGLLVGLGLAGLFRRRQQKRGR